MRQRRTRPDRPTTRALAADGAKHAATLGLSTGAWLTAMGSFAGSTWDLDAWVGVARGLAWLVVVVLVGHVLPTALLRQVSWLWSSLATLLACAVLAVASAGPGAPAALVEVPAGMLLLALPVLTATIVLRSVVGPLRPTLALRTPITPVTAHARS